MIRAFAAAVIALALAVQPQQSVEQTSMGTRAGSTLVESFDGIGVGFEGPQGKYEGRNPSDNSLAVGPDHIVQTVNSRLIVFTKKGKKFDTTGKALYGPVETKTVFAGLGGPCEARNNGDAVVRYDQLADRWLVTMPIFSRIPLTEVGERPPVRYRLVVERPSALGSGGTRCADVLRARGVNAWVSALSGPPGADGIVFPGLGSIAFSAAPVNAVSVGSPVGGAASVLKLRGGTTIRGDLAGLGCDPGQMQLNFWDTGRGKPPVLTVSDPGGHPLCGSIGQPACLTNPPAQRWVSWTFSTPGTIRSLSLEGDELFLSSVVIQ